MKLQLTLGTAEKPLAAVNISDWLCVIIIVHLSPMLSLLSHTREYLIQIRYPR